MARALLPQVQLHEAGAKAVRPPQQVQQAAVCNDACTRARVAQGFQAMMDRLCSATGTCELSTVASDQFQHEAGARAVCPPRQVQQAPIQNDAFISAITRSAMLDAVVMTLL